MPYNAFTQFAMAALLRWGLYSPKVVELLAMIAAHESLGCRYRKQVGGPALGIFQMEPETHDSVWQFCDSIRARAARFNIRPDSDELEHSDEYALFVARHYLLMDPNPLPDTPEAMAAYCKAYWNRTGAATPEKYLTDYNNWRSGAKGYGV